MDADDLTAVLTAVRSFVREHVVPLEQEIEDTDTLPASVKDGAAAMGLFGFAIPEEFGGLGLNSTEQARLVMELGWTRRRRCAAWSAPTTASPGMCSSRAAPSSSRTSGSPNSPAVRSSAPSD